MGVDLKTACGPTTLFIGVSSSSRRIRRFFFRYPVTEGRLSEEATGTPRILGRRVVIFLTTFVPVPDFLCPSRRLSSSGTGPPQVGGHGSGRPFDDHPLYPKGPQIGIGMVAEVINGLQRVYCGLNGNWPSISPAKLGGYLPWHLLYLSRLPLGHGWLLVGFCCSLRPETLATLPVPNSSSTILPTIFAVTSHIN